MMPVQALIHARDARKNRVLLITEHVVDPADKPRYARLRTESAGQFA